MCECRSIKGNQTQAFQCSPNSVGTLSVVSSTGPQTVAQAEIYRMIRRRASGVGIGTKLLCHSFRATGITVYLQNGGKLEAAQQMAGHESARTTELYDRRNDAVALDELEKIAH